MILWIDAQLSPHLASWIVETLGITAFSVLQLGLRDATDEDIFVAARQQEAIVVTKDADFVQLQERLGAPPKIVWVTCGNTSNLRMREIFTNSLKQACTLLEQGEILVEISE